MSKRAPSSRPSVLRGSPGFPQSRTIDPPWLPKRSFWMSKASYFRLLPNYPVPAKGPQLGPSLVRGTWTSLPGWRSFSTATDRRSDPPQLWCPGPVLACPRCSPRPWGCCKEGCSLLTTRQAPVPNPRGRSSGWALGLLPQHRQAKLSTTLVLWQEFDILKNGKIRALLDFLMLILQLGIVLNYFGYCNFSILRYQ